MDKSLDSSEQYRRLKARRTGLKASVTRQLSQLESLAKASNAVAFEDKRESLQGTLKKLKENLNLISDLQLNLPADEFDEATADLEDNERNLEEKESLAADLKCAFDNMIKPKNSNTVQIDEASNHKSKFTPKSLRAPIWDGEITTLNSWKIRVNDYFSLTGLDGDKEQLVILLHDDVLPKALLSTLYNCNSTKELFECLDARFPSESIPEAVLLRLKETKSMTSGSAKEMRRMLEEIKIYARCVKESGHVNDLECSATINLIEQKLATSIVRDFRRWLYRDHKTKRPNVDLLITFLTNETEVEERLNQTCSNKSPSKPKLVNAGKIHSTQLSSSSCALCGENRHKFVECKIFINYTPKQRTDAMKRLGRCFTCLAAMHSSPKDCKYRRSCKNCGRSHHTMLNCVERKIVPSNNETDQVNTTPLNANTPAFQHVIPTTNSCTINLQKFSPLMYVDVLGNDGKWRRCVALLDSGSDVTLVKRELVSSLKLDRKPQKLKFGTAGGGFLTEDSALVSLWVRNTDKKAYRFSINAFELSKPAHKTTSIEDEFFEEHSYLNPIKNFVPTKSEEIDILLGFDYANLMQPQAYLKHPDHSAQLPQAAETPLGWYIFGANISSQHGVIDGHLTIQFVRTDSENLRQWYDADICGVKPTRICACSEKQIVESQFIKHVQKTIHKTDKGRIEVSLPWKDGFPGCFKSNRKQALMKLNSLEHRLRKSNLIETYKSEMEKILKEFAEPVPFSDLKDEESWYLDHFPVLRPDKTTPCRIVWNSAAVYGGLSLNDGLRKGPDLLNNLFLTLISWRLNPIAVVGDIKKMFNQVQIAPSDRAYHRFLWRDGDSNSPAKDYQWKRLPFGDKSAPDLAISALHFVADDYIDIYPFASHILKNSCYMDDIAFSVNSEHTAVQTKEELNAILSSGKFSVKNWHSNSKLTDEFPDSAVTDVLGHFWDKQSDLLKVKFNPLKLPEVVTKRIILSTIAKLWDPLGILAPVTISLRIFMQSLWQSKLSWDEPIQTDILVEFTKILQEVNALQNFWLERCIQPNLCSQAIELHGFCDAGEQAYGAVIWMRHLTSETNYLLRFVAAKTFVAPLKKRSIPRLELMAIVVLTRLTTTILNVIKCKKVTLWTDSTVVLHWLKISAANFKPFVATRVQEVQDSLRDVSHEIRYIKSSLNPADSLTKPIKANRLLSWLKGPEFLNGSIVEEPPDKNLLDNAAQISRKEEKKKPCFSLHLSSVLSFAESLTRRISTWTKLVRVMAWLRRPLLLRKNRSTVLQPSELNNAKLTLFWLAQELFRRPEQHRLREKLNLMSQNSEHEVLRVRGRLSNFPYREDARTPIVLPRNNAIVKLYAKHIHEELGHQGYRVVIVHLHESGIYIPRGRELLKSIASKCIYCRKLRRELLQQQMGQLPQFRFEIYRPPFTSVSLDYFGPVKVRKSRNIVIEGAILLITCNTTRVVHLELSETQSTDDFLLAWRRFVTKRGIHPAHVFTDQAKNFVGARKVIQDWVSSWDKVLISNSVAANGTSFKWEFNVPRASHMNGTVESLIRSCRKALQNATNFYKHSHTRNEWETIISEGNYLVNSRPLLPKTTGCLEEEPITGNTILYPYGQAPVSSAEMCEAVDPRASTKKAQAVINIFWESWMRNMPPHLLLRNKWFRARENLKVGDYVIVLEPSLKNKTAPRGLWEHAIVTKTFPGSDGLVRKVELRLARQRKLVRPIHKLCLIATAEELLNVN